jgi:hypothetical protein
MRSSYDKAFEITVGLEGKLSTDPNDPGNYFPDGSPGFTIWGLSTKYNKNLTKDMTLQAAKDRYLYDYWIPAACDNIPFRFDICLFDSQVNPQNDPKLPGVGNVELLLLNPENWQDYNILRMQRYLRVSKREFVLGHISRVLVLSEKVKALKVSY